MTPTIDRFTTEVSDFTLRGLEGLNEEYVPPPLGQFTPDGSWQHAYAMYLLIPHASIHVGAFSLVRKPGGSADFTLSVHTQRRGNSGYSQFQLAHMECKQDTLATPISWTFETKMALKPDDPPYLQSGRKRSVSVRDGVMRIQDKLHTTQTPLNGPYGNEWSMLEAVQRLPLGKTQPIHYTLIDEYDTPQSNHTLAFRDKVTVPFKNGPLQLTSYCDLGSAVIPTTYWVDEHSRLLFVCSGLQVYALNATNGQAGYCPPRYSLPTSDDEQEHLPEPQQ